jgi:glycosyltransferase involved in cell wall biosynthesis
MTFNLLAIDLEPAPYKVDLWNSFSANPAWNITVLYSNAKDISKDAGHNYQELPASTFRCEIFQGHSPLATLYKICKTIQAILDKKINVVFISGYVNAAPLAAILTCVLLRKPFFVHSDIFNLHTPLAPLALFKRWVRENIRAVIFRFSTAVLVCGKLGYESAIAAGCPSEKVVDFPYAISRERLQLDLSESIPESLVSDVQTGRIAAYFSGRMIARKGLSTLLEAIASIESSVDKVTFERDWVVWLAGEGPLLPEYRALVVSLGISHRVRFLGFVQMKLHSWLLRNASIILVPSFADAWGIVVDEGMQLGKPVIASTGVGSAVDRIESGENGLLFAPGNAPELESHLLRLLSSEDLRNSLGKRALCSSRIYSPQRNISNLQQIFSQSVKERL